MITNVDKQDEEKYKCTATNLVGQMTTESVLRLACKSMAYYLYKSLEVNGISIYWRGLFVLKKETSVKNVRGYSQEISLS